MRSSLPLLAAVLVALGLAAHAQDGGILLLGQTADLSGPQAAPVKETTAAARAYFDKVNAQGGVNGRKIVLESLDRSRTRRNSSTRSTSSRSSCFAAPRTPRR
jgi:branched-chain amino acid transport system substrate-binding protein